MSPLNQTRLEKTAVDAGYDLTPRREGAWMQFASTRLLGTLALTLTPHGILVAFDAACFDESWLTLPGITGNPGTVPDVTVLGVIANEVRVVAVEDFSALHGLLQTASRQNPGISSNPVWRNFVERTWQLPRTTEQERTVITRIGQDLFRKALFNYWQGQCPVTGLSISELLRASHIKPWTVCANNAERLNVHNGLLLAPHLDAAFDRGFITFDMNGHLLPAPALDEENAHRLGISTDMGISGLTPTHQQFLEYHRAKVFGA